MQKIDINIDEVAETVYEIRKELDKSKYIGKNYANKYMAVVEKFENFEKRYPIIVKYIIDGKDLKLIANFLVHIEEINSGKISLEDKEKQLAKYMEETFIKPALDKKK